MLSRIASPTWASSGSTCFKDQFGVSRRQSSAAYLRPALTQQRHRICTERAAPILAQFPNVVYIVLKPRSSQRTAGAWRSLPRQSRESRPKHKIRKERLFSITISSISTISKSSSGPPISTSRPISTKLKSPWPLLAYTFQLRQSRHLHPLLARRGIAGRAIAIFWCP